MVSLINKVCQIFHKITDLHKKVKEKKIYQTVGILHNYNITRKVSFVI